jgi:hypothetical protein
LTIKLFYTGCNTKKHVSILNTVADQSESDYTSDRTTLTEVFHSHNSEISDRNADIEIEVTADRLTETTTTIKQGEMMEQLDSKSRHNLYFPDRQGHAMEVARMMPARFSNIVSNVPFYMVVTCSTWIGFHIMFATYDYSPDSHYNDKSEQAWITMLLVLFYVVVGMITEFVAYLIRKNGSDCSCENVNCKETMATGGRAVPYKSQMDSLDVAKIPKSMDAFYNDVFEEYYSRPNEDEYLLDAQKSSAPAIFLCAPVPMAESVQNAVHKENSSLLLTRYVVYEESFVM